MQAVLSAASHRATTLLQKAVNGAIAQKETKAAENSTAYIPVPDAAGVVENYEELYPTGRWTEPHGFVKFSYTIDEWMPAALVDGFTYVMDERDAEWLDKNNQEARGEGTSSQAASSGTTTRGNLHRSAKAKGKEAEASTPITMTEGDFELVMGLFEKVTHDNTPFLHVVRVLPFQCMINFLMYNLNSPFSNSKDRASRLSRNTTTFLRMNFLQHISLVLCVLLTYRILKLS